MTLFTAMNYTKISNRVKIFFRNSTPVNRTEQTVVSYLVFPLTTLATNVNRNKRYELYFSGFKTI